MFLSKKKWILLDPVPVRPPVTEYINLGTYFLDNIGIYTAEGDVFVIFQMADILAPGIQQQGSAGIVRLNFDS